MSVITLEGIGVCVVTKVCKEYNYFWSEEESIHPTKLLFVRFLRPARWIWTSINRFWLVTGFQIIWKRAFTLASIVRCAWHPNYGCVWGFFLPDMAFWISYCAFGCVHLTETEWPINNIVTTHKGRGTQIRSLEVSDVASLWSCGTNCMWRAGSNSCYLDVLHCLTVYSNQGTNRSWAFINCQTQKGKTQGSVLKMSAVIAVRPLFALGKGGVRWCQGRLCQSFVVFGLVFVTLQIIVLFL